MADSYTIWSNAGLPAAALALLQQNLGPHRLLFASQTHSSNLVAGKPDPLLAEADIAFGQPDPLQVIELPKLRWLHLTSAGYTRYDTREFHTAIQNRGGIFTNSSSVFSEPCAEHVLAMILALARRLPQAVENQRKDASWKCPELRSESRLLENQTAVIYGLGAIARRLIELLLPLRMNLTAVRRTLRGDETIPTVTPTEAEDILPIADHVISILPGSSETEGFFNADRFSRIKRGAVFYNIGRGSTVDQRALIEALETGRLGAAYLDVTTPEPLPPDHPLWKLPNCFITPHCAGGHANESERVVRHFVNNLRRFEKGAQMLDVIIRK